MDSFLSLESVYGAGTAEITAKLASMLREHEQVGHPDDDPDEGRWSKLVKEIESHFEENEDILEQMELEIRSWSQELQSEKQKADHRLQSYKVELQRLKKEFLKGVRHHQRTQERGQLGLSDGSHDPENQKQGLLDNTETLERSSRKLRQGHGLLAETESIGASILNDLTDQRETIQRSRSKLRDTQDDLHSSSRILTKMLMRIIQNKAVLFGLAFLIFLLFVISIFYFLGS
ncbi:hypothetical protein TCAL_04338 [Tigriopus californicus]|uniref:t-SNARE coiled-coil homology domain-containing protein n=1 Tax=Tigriopus californicus TaxID=6832 RepID=A0A553PRM3_TIGCA|nr:vesicle transport through interaction with t-SNAREs homolog 1A-like [Tigriopus californicus]TRY80338.1 hypothetical protein TCAL_04338 [Tigriopus californicus]